jgi:hypothetical protein
LPTYIASAMILGVYFALNSGTVDSIVYDAVLEETGSSEQYEMWIGRVRMVESGAFVRARSPAVCSPAGLRTGSPTSRRCPFVAVAIAAFLRFDEPRLHRAAEPGRAAPPRPPSHTGR